MLVCGLVGFRQLVETSLHHELNEFHWLVLMDGSTLEIDEVGFFLKQLPLVKTTTFISPENALENLQSNSMLFDDMSGFDVADFPRSWKVTWEPEIFNSPLLNDFMMDTRRLEGVIDVAADAKAFERIAQINLTLQKMDVGLMAMAGVFGLLMVLLLIRYFFIPPFPHFKLKSFLFTLLIDTVWWSIGYVVMSEILGGAPLYLLLGGLVFGCLHYIWSSYDSFFATE